ncbi:Bro-N domain-containing protein [Pseudescherichia sp.]|uniref:BRO-N domain-containing protein n=1 Tax=Pseudescherichia sp. TaxID=2055881 RepID=UPI00390CC9BD
MIGHPDHELLFVAKQVADMAGFKNGSNAVYSFMQNNGIEPLRISDLSPILWETLVRHPRVLPRSTLMNESATYRMLLRGHAPQSEPFRKWVTEEVLPSIRKTGSYDIAKSETPEGLQFAEEFGKLRAEIGMLASEDTVCVCETT